MSRYIMSHIIILHIISIAALLCCNVTLYHVTYHHIVRCHLDMIRHQVKMVIGWVKIMPSQLYKIRYDEIKVKKKAE